MPVKHGGSSCSVYLYGHAAVVNFLSSTLDLAPACRSWTQVQAAGGTYWSRYGQQAADDSSVCMLVSADGAGASATVMDDGGQVFGQAACQRF
jgi:hypothetical protein